MTTIRVAVPHHNGEGGEEPAVVDLHPEDLYCVLPDDGAHPYYAFNCPRCGIRVEKKMDDKALNLLMAAGVDVVDVSLELEELEEWIEGGVGS